MRMPTRRRRLPVVSWILASRMAGSTGTSSESFISVESKVRDPRNRDGSKSGTSVAAAVSSPAVTSTSYSSTVMAGPSVSAPATRSQRRALSTSTMLLSATVFAWRKVTGSESNRTIARASSVSPRTARSSCCSAPVEGNPPRVVSSSTAKSVSCSSAAGCSGHSTLQPSPPSSVSSQAAIVAAAATIARSGKDFLIQTFTETPVR
jgi:hypothetical protein